MLSWPRKGAIEMDVSRPVGGDGTPDVSVSTAGNGRPVGISI